MARFTFAGFEELLNGCIPKIEVSAEIRPLLESREHSGAADLTL